MGKKKKQKTESNGGAADESTPWCYFCDREFEHEEILIQHQKAKHFKCPTCGKKLNTLVGLVIHSQTVHRETLNSVPHAKPRRADTSIEVFGMTGIPADAVAERTAKRAEMGFQPPLPEETPPAEGNGFTPPLPDASRRTVAAPPPFPPRPQFPIPPSVLGLPPFQPPPSMPGIPPPIGGFPPPSFALPRMPRFPGMPGLPQPPFPMPMPPPSIQTPTLPVPAGGSPATSGSVLPQPPPAQPPALPDLPPAPHVNLEISPPLPPDTSTSTAVGVAAVAPPPPAPPEALKYELSVEEQRAALPRYAILSR